MVFREKLTRIGSRLSQGRDVVGHLGLTLAVPGSVAIDAADLIFCDFD